MANYSLTRVPRGKKRRCHLCSREFSKTEHLERHIRSHTKEKPFECQQCGKKYGRNDSLLRHLKDQHQTTTSYGQVIEAQSALPAGDLPGILPGNHVEEGHRAIQASTSTSLLNSFDTVPVGALSQHSIHTDATAVGELWPSTLSKSWLPENLGLGNWLSQESIDGFLHNWPFVVDDADMGPAVNNTAVFNNRKPLADLRYNWYTHLELDESIASGYATPNPRRNEVDDNYRQSLHRRLEIQSTDQSLPSTDYLNICVRLYFKRFHHIFPVIHAPTFRPSQTNAVLLLSICSIGSLLTGHPNAVQRGIQLFERLHKAILAHWEKLMRRGPDETLAVIQASLLGQTFGLLSGQAKNLALVDAFHGTVISWARRARLFQTRHSPFGDDQDVESRWRGWIRTEERIRVALGLRVHDAEIASILHHEPLLLSASKVSHAASDALFFAASPQEWLPLYRQKYCASITSPSGDTSTSPLPETPHQRLVMIPPDRHFTIYAALEDISSTIIEKKINESLTAETIDAIQNCLIAYYRHLDESDFEPLCSGGKILWHYLFISLHSDLDLLERSIGRDGSDLDPSDLANVHEWANSKSAKRCAAHAIKMKRILESFPVSSEPAIHVPRSIFAGALCLFCYSKYSDGTTDAPIHFPEFQALDAEVTSLLREAKSGSSADFEISSVCSLVDLLQRIGHWEISRTFASILKVLLQIESS